MTTMHRTRLLFALPLLAASLPAHADSLPQMDTTWYANELLWLAFSFATIFALVSWFIAPTIKAVIRTRENAIADAIREAERAQAEADSTRGAATSEHESARVKAVELLANAQAEANRAAADAMAKLDHELNRKASQTAAILEEAVARAQSGIDAAAQSLASSIAGSLLNQPAQSDEPKLKLAVKRG